ncbi:hypothetical protein Rcae01_06022 [Novipirellula caenicola]|uniref:Secreted protein n=1 Tax=Novipirellula caenicola TaxID=1536901 RepID=A0ABP9W1Y5_9BACT
MWQAVASVFKFVFAAGISAKNESSSIQVRLVQGNPSDGRDEPICTIHWWIEQMGAPVTSNIHPH